MRGKHAAHNPLDEKIEYLTPSQLKRVVQDLATSQDAKKLAFAAILGQTLDRRDSQLCQYFQFLRHCMERKSAQAIPQEILDGWREAALEKAIAHNDVWALNMLATFDRTEESDRSKAVHDAAVLHWQKIEPENLAPFLYQGRIFGNDLYKQAITRSHFTEYNYPIVRWMYQTLSQQLPHQQKAIAQTVLGIEADIPWPDYIMMLCMNDPPKISLDEKTCRHVGKLLREQQTSTPLLNARGIQVLRKSATDVEKQTLDEELAYFRELWKGEANVYTIDDYLLRLQDETINSLQQEMESRAGTQGRLLPPRPEKDST